jgi:L-serine dehydratase
MEPMKYRSVFEIIGPIMIGPSSSHTAGAVRIGQLARKLFGREPERVDIHLYGSFAQTYRGHATDVAVIGGIMAFETDDPRIKDSLNIAESHGIAVQFIREEAVPVHPNTLKIVMTAQAETIELIGISIGGGAVQITELSGFPLKLSGDCPAILILHQDVFGTVAAVANILANRRINISHMEVSRIEKGQTALMVIETDQTIPQDAIAEMSAQEHIVKVVVLDV